MELSFTAEQINRISQLAKEELFRGLTDSKTIADAKAQKLKNAKRRIKGLEEKLINDEIEPLLLIKNGLPSYQQKKAVSK